MTALDHQLDRTIVIEAPPAAVFKHFTDPARWAAWWGAGSTIDARPGGGVFIRYPDGTEVSGEVVEVTPPSHIVFTYGYVTGSPFAAGASAKWPARDIACWSGPGLPGCRRRRKPARCGRQAP